MAGLLASLIINSPPSNIPETRNTNTYKALVISGPFIKGKRVTVRIFEFNTWRHDKRTKKITMIDGLEHINALTFPFRTKAFIYDDNHVVLIIRIKDRQKVFYHNNLPKELQ